MKKAFATGLFILLGACGLLAVNNKNFAYETQRPHAGHISDTNQPIRSDAVLEEPRTAIVRAPDEHLHSVLEERQAATTGGVELPLTALDRLRATMLEKNSDIAQHRQLQRTVLKTSDQKEVYQAMLRDPELLNAAKRDLLSSEAVFSEESQLVRMYRIAYLDSALEWTENPERESVLEIMRDVVLAQNIKATFSPEHQRSLAGDKVELMLSLWDRDSEKATEIEHKTIGTELEGLMAYAHRKYNALTSD